MRLLKWLLGATLIATALRAQTEWLHFRGMCDASALEMLTDDLFVVGNDEDNVLRVYSRRQQGFPVQTLDFSSFYALKKRTLEIDLEAAARIGNRIYWISSHGANAKGKVQPSRHRFFATEIIQSNGVPRLRPMGRLYSGLIRDLSLEPGLASLHLQGASRLPPKNPGALNIEGLAPTPEGHLLIGFRNPIPGGKALVIRLLNPEPVTLGEKARFSAPQFVDLGGFGIRSLTPYREGYLLVAGPYQSEGGPSRLYFWNGTAAKPEEIPAQLGANPEGIAIIPGASTDRAFLISDDGAVKVGGSECKRLKDNALKSFRAFQFPISVDTAHGKPVSLR